MGMVFLGLRHLCTKKVTTGIGVPRLLPGNHNAGDHATARFLVRDMGKNVFMPVQDIIGKQITERIIRTINPNLA